VPDAVLEESAETSTAVAAAVAETEAPETGDEPAAVAKDTVVSKDAAEAPAGESVADDSQESTDK
jgi:peptide/nickel transport system ATP-binding protein